MEYNGWSGSTDNPSYFEMEKTYDNSGLRIILQIRLKGTRLILEKLRVSYDGKMKVLHDALYELDYVNSGARSKKHHLQLFLGKLERGVIHNQVFTVLREHLLKKEAEANQKAVKLLMDQMKLKS